MRPARWLPPEYPDDPSLTMLEAAFLRQRAPAMKGYEVPFALGSNEEAVAYFSRIIRTSHGMLVIDEPALVSVCGREDQQHRSVSTVQDFPYVCVSVRERNKNLCLMIEGGLNICSMPLIDESRVEAIALPGMLRTRLFGPKSSLAYGALDIAADGDKGMYWLPK